MKLSLLAVSARSRATPLNSVATTFIERLAAYVTADMCLLPTEEGVLQAANGGGRTAPKLVLLDSRGRLLSSEQLAQWIAKERDAGIQHLLFAIGPADGWSEETRRKADLLLSFGPMTFPHELARVMLAEQLYRAFTILAGHPYHAGH